MKKARRLSIRGNKRFCKNRQVHGKWLGTLLLFGILFCGIGTGCVAGNSGTEISDRLENAEQSVGEAIMDMENIKSKISGTIVVGSREEKEAADQVTQKLFVSLENGDKKAIKELFSPYAKKNAINLDEKIEELIAYYPGADGGYDGVSISTEDRDYGKKSYILELILTVTDQGKEYQIFICLQMRNDFDSSKEGVHLIEIIREEEKGKNFHWKEYGDLPGIYVGE